MGNGYIPKAGASTANRESKAARIQALHDIDIDLMDVSRKAKHMSRLWYEEGITSGRLHGAVRRLIKQLEDIADQLNEDRR
mgnify:CR=1 FL=1